MSIVALDQNTTKFLTTTQIVTSVYSAVKELVENALDAGANSIDIKLDDKGMSLIEVSDNGKGIPKTDSQYMGLQSYTSKIKDFSDLDALRSYGFRGEALSSLCRVADVTIITKTEQDITATLYTMNHDGTIRSSELCHRSVGTTVQARSMFKDLPVRKQIMSSTKRSNQDVKSLENLLRSFGICQPSIRISYKVNSSVFLTKPSTKTLEETLHYLFGKKLVSQIDYIESKSPEISLLLTVPRKDATELLEICQMGQFVFVNDRPVFYKDIEKEVNKRLVEFFGDRIPTRKKAGFIVNLKVPSQDVDVNLEPNKTAVLLTNQAKIVATLDKLLVQYYGITENAEDISNVQPMNESRSEYHDYTNSSIRTSVEPEGVPSCKKRKVENDNEKAITSAAKSTKKIATDKTPKNQRTAKKLFNTPTNRIDSPNKENYCANGLPSTESEIINSSFSIMGNESQLPVIDLGEDFSTQEIANMPCLDPKEVEANLKAFADKNSITSTSKPKETIDITEAAWSRGRLPIKLHGGTDVHVYSTADKDAKSKVEKTDPGFLKFSKEIRLQIISENPSINYVEVGKMMVTRWKELSPEERGYYRDLASKDKTFNQRENDTRNESMKPVKQQVKAKHAEVNRKRFLNMLENMKNMKTSTKKSDLIMRTFIPFEINLEGLTQSFLKRKANDSLKKKNIVLGRLNENIWLARTGFQIWALNIDKLFDGLSIEKSERYEKTRENIEDLVERWMREKEDMSLMHPVFDIN